MPTRAFALLRRLGRASLFVLLPLSLFGAPSAAQSPAEPDSAAFITRLGRDTLAVERWVRTGDRIEAEAVVRSPRTTVRRYTLLLDEAGRMRRFEEHTFDAPGAGRAPLRSEIVEVADGRWRRTLTEGDSTRTGTFEADPSALPFIDLVFWPYELAVQRAPGQGEITQPLLAGGRVLPFKVSRAGAGTATVTHPFRGPSTVRIDADGRVLVLDASETTRKVSVTRAPWVDLEAHARRWIAADRAGRGVGELSGRAQVEASVAGAHLFVDYGTPSKRGREIFGTVVPWNEVWRTGANRATHFTTDRTLVLGSPSGETLEVPPGEYTLFSIPAPEGGVLIVSRQTGQNGNSYDPAQDLGRVPMTREATAAPVEQFTIEAEERGSQRGVLRLVWDRTAFSVPFTVR